MKRSASAIWKGGLKDGKGVISTDSNVLSQTPYSFTTRFEGERGTNPEELVAAAHAGCFSMALSAELGKAGVTPESINTTATTTLEQQDAGWAVTQVHLEVRARFKNAADAQKLHGAAEAAKAGCPISKLLNARISMNAQLDQ